MLETNSESGDRFKFTGREWNAELGLYYYRARFYDPIAGRFVSRDPIGFAGRDQNLYRYVGNSPQSFTDPTGNISYGTFVKVSITIATTIGGAVVGYTCGYAEGRARGLGHAEAEAVARQQAVVGAVVGLGIGAVAAAGGVAGGAIAGSTGTAAVAAFFGTLGAGLAVINIAESENITIFAIRVGCTTVEVVTGRAIAKGVQRLSRIPQVRRFVSDESGSAGFGDRSGTGGNAWWRRKKSKRWWK